MRDPGHFAIVDDAGIELYYGPKGALDIDSMVFAGPDRAVRKIREAREWYWPCSGLDAWYGDFNGFCEGAVLVDLRRRMLALFTIYLGHYPYRIGTYADRAALRAVLAETWPGWEIRWAYEGGDDIARYLGVPAEFGYQMHWAPGLSPFDAAQLEQHELDPASNDVELLVTVAERDQPVRGYIMWNEAHEALKAGPTLLSRLPASARVTELAQPPVSGLHFDTIDRSAVLWTTTSGIPGMHDDWRARWPGWQFEFCEDRYAQQLARCDDRLLILEPDVAASLNMLARRFAPETPAKESSMLAAIDRARARSGPIPHWAGMAGQVGLAAPPKLTVSRDTGD